MMNIKIYLDTSVLGGYYDKEFGEDTIKLFEYIAEENVEVIFSDILAEELKKAPNNVRSLLSTVRNVTYVSIDEDAEALAKMYLEEGALGKKSLNDAYHIAIATIKRAQAIVSWNFKHMVNFRKVKQYNSINLREGYGIIDIYSPSDMIRMNYRLKN